MWVYLKLISTGSIFRIYLPEDLEPSVLNLKKLLAPQVGLISPTGSLYFDLKTLELIKISDPTLELVNLENSALIPEHSESQPLGVSLYFSAKVSTGSIYAIVPYKPSREMARDSEIQWLYDANTQRLTSVLEIGKTQELRKDQLAKYLDLLLLKSEIDPEPKRYITYHRLQACLNGQVLGQAIFPSSLFETYRRHPHQITAPRGIDLKNICWIPNSNLLEATEHAQYFEAMQGCFYDFTQIINHVFPALNMFKKTLLEQQLHFFEVHLNKLREKISPPRPPRAISVEPGLTPSPPQPARRVSTPSANLFGLVASLFRPASPLILSAPARKPGEPEAPEEASPLA